MQNLRLITREYEYGGKDHKVLFFILCGIVILSIFFLDGANEKHKNISSIEQFFDKVLVYHKHTNRIFPVARTEGMKGRGRIGY